MKGTVLACTLIGLPAFGAAETSPVTQNAVFMFNGEEVVISRTSTVDPSTLSALSDHAAPCASPCLSSMIVAPGVATLGELEVIDFLSSDVAAGTGLLVDARMPEDRATGFIPASVNVPAATLAPSNPYRNEILMALGAEQFQGVFDFTEARSLVVFDGGPGTQDAPALIIDLLAAGYPTDKVFYYRGGAQVWAMLGLSTTKAVQ